MRRTLVWLSLPLMAVLAWSVPAADRDDSAGLQELHVLPEAADVAAGPELQPEEVQREFLDNLATMGVSEEEAGALAAGLLATIEPVEALEAPLAEAPALSPDEVRRELLDHLSTMDLSREEASALSEGLLATIEPVEGQEAPLAEAPALSPDEVRQEFMDNLATMGVSGDEASVLAEGLAPAIEWPDDASATSER